MTREELIVAAEIAFERLMTPTRGLPPELMEEPMREGKWSFKELAAHFVFWDEIFVRALEEINYGRTFDWSPYVGHFDEWNAKAADRLKPQSVKRVLAEWRLTHSTLTEAFRKVSDQTLLKDGEVRASVIEAILQHYEHHIPEVEAWAERMRSQGRAPAPLNILGGA